MKYQERRSRKALLACKTTALGASVVVLGERTEYRDVPALCLDSRGLLEPGSVATFAKICGKVDGEPIAQTNKPCVSARESGAR